ncbi:alanine--glyoxylate aminotransferase family protein [Candidatus Bipolaricaulota bacterium]|nr:alanine--glyoxylate aminotransferase family protein [Candidatus Bipolaricaulota bacterium]
MHEKLFTPGPTEVRTELLQELSTAQIHHRTEEFSDVYDDIQPRLKKLLFTDNPVFLFTSSSTGAMESAVTNGVKKKSLTVSNGAFSERWHKITRKNGVPADILNQDWGKPVTPEMVDEKLATGEYDAVTMVFNETSTGMMNPVKEVGKVVNSYDDTMFLVDAVSGMAGAKIKVDDWGIDMCLAGVQKAFGLPSGLAVASVSERLLERAEDVEPRSYYFNLPLLHKYHKRSQTRTTPAIPQILALRKQLKYIVDEEGIENRFARHDRLSGIVQNWAKQYFDIFPEEGYWSKTLTCVENTRGISVADLNQELIEKHNMRIANGYGDMSEETFRISNMADLSEPDVRGLLATINDILGL